MYSKLFIFVLCLSVVLAAPPLGRSWIGAGNGLIGAGGYGLAGTGLIGNGLVGTGLVNGGLGLGYAGTGLGLAKAAPIAVAGGLTGGLGLAGIGLAGPGVGYYGTGLSNFALTRIGTGIAPYAGPVAAAVQTIRTQQVIDVPTSPDVIQPSTLVIEPNVLPVNIEFRSQSSPVNVNQVHIPGRPGIVERTSSEEEPDRLIHEVVKPVVQEVRETIVPFRRITQEILPVQEEVHSLVARGQNQKVIAADAPVARVAAVAAPAVAAVAAPVGVAVAPAYAGGLITTGINRINGGLIGAGLVRGGLVGTGGLVGAGLVNGGLVGTGYGLNGGLVGTGLGLNGGLIGTGLGLNGGLVSPAGVVKGGYVKGLPTGLELIKA